MDDEQFDKMQLEIDRADLEQLRGIARLQVIGLRLEHRKREKLKLEYDLLCEQARRDRKDVEDYKAAMRDLYSSISDLAQKTASLK